MAKPDLTNKTIAIVATDYFEESELFKPIEALRAFGAKVDVIAPHNGKIIGLNHLKSGESVTVNKRLSEADPRDYDAVVFPGGAVNADQLRMVDDARDFLSSMLKAGKPTALICHAPWILISAGVAKGRSVTSYYTLQDDLMNAGADWIDREVVEDRNLITSRNPDDLPVFIDTIIYSLV